MDDCGLAELVSWYILISICFLVLFQKKLVRDGESGFEPVSEDSDFKDRLS